MSMPFVQISIDHRFVSFNIRCRDQNLPTCCEGQTSPSLNSQRTPSAKDNNMEVTCEIVYYSVGIGAFVNFLRSPDRRLGSR